jgi:hypothetical protein
MALVIMVDVFMALLSFRGISTPSLPAQGEQRRSTHFNIGRDIPHEKYLVASYSVDRHIAYINEVRTVATSRDQTRTVANVRALENKGEPEPRTPTTSSEQSRTDANVRAPDDRYVTRLEGEVDFLRSEISTKNAQIVTTQVDLDGSRRT